MRRFGIAICMVMASIGTASAADEAPDPPTDETVDCPPGTTEIEGGSACETLPGEDCPDDWNSTGWNEDLPSDPHDGTEICTCDGETDPLGNCSGDPDGVVCPDGYVELEGLDTCVLDPNDNDGLGGNGEPCPIGFDQIGGDDWGICYCRWGHTNSDGTSCESLYGSEWGDIACLQGEPVCIDIDPDPQSVYYSCWCNTCPDGWEDVIDGYGVCQPIGLQFSTPPSKVVVWGQDHVVLLDYDSVNVGYIPSGEINWYTSTTSCEIGKVELDDQCVEACTIWEIPCLGDPGTEYVWQMILRNNDKP